MDGASHILHRLKKPFQSMHVGVWCLLLHTYVAAPPLSTALHFFATLHITERRLLQLHLYTSSLQLCSAGAAGLRTRVRPSPTNGHGG